MGAKIKLRDTYKIDGEKIVVFSNGNGYVYIDVTGYTGPVRSENLHTVRLGFKPKHLRRFIKALRAAQA